MLLLNIENKDIITGVYNGEEPRVEDITIKEVSIITGKDLRVIIKFDTTDLPKSLPVKWRIRGVNCVQFVMECVNVNLNNVYITDECRHIKLEVHPQGDKKIVVFKDVFEKVIVELEARWIYLRNITGYTDTTGA